MGPLTGDHRAGGPDWRRLLHPRDPQRHGIRFLPRFGYVFAEQGHFLPGSFEIVGEPMFLTVFQHQTVYVGGLAALLKY
ncbi:MAG TPA: hypothetical protein VN648_08415, partial [Candidatus Methylomirabilis sp.]|nr:hypothetical protein [Candidatus Methylomirabilis sp.]